MKALRFGLVVLLISVGTTTAWWTLSATAPDADTVSRAVKVPEPVPVERPLESVGESEAVVGMAVEAAASGTDYEVIYRDGAVVQSLPGVRGGGEGTAGRIAVAAPGAGLRQREVPLKELLMQPSGSVHRLVVKFMDGFQARADGRNLSVVASERLEPLAEIIRKHRLVFSRLHTVADDQISKLAERAASLSGVAQPDLLGMLAVFPVAVDRESVWRAALALHALPEVEFVSVEAMDAPPPPPAADITPTSELLTGFQSYRTSTGINVDYAWSQFGTKGAGVKVTDCEYYYDATHEDLSGLVSVQPGVNGYYIDFGSDHGTAVLGVLGSGENAYGMTGAIPQAALWFYPEYSTVNGAHQSRVASITAAIAASAPGDVVLLEMQHAVSSGGKDYGPAEYGQAVWTAVRTGTDAGVIVVAAAGNGALNLDGTSFAAYRGRGDSGAILVGAGTTARARSSFSTYGSRINLQGWGGNVASLGYGDFRKYGGDSKQAYTNTFSGTSSASPIVTAAVVLTQSVARARLSRSLSPMEMRQLLIDTGKVQTGDLTRMVGPLPDLAAALPLLLARFKPTMNAVEVFGRYYFNTPALALEADPDHDGMSNLIEYFIGSDPTVGSVSERARLPRVSPVIEDGHPGFAFQFQRNLAAADTSWRVEVANRLGADTQWNPLVSGVGAVIVTQDMSGNVRVFIPQVAEGEKFFARLVVTKSGG